MNTIRYNRGAGIALSGSVQESGAAGTPKIAESPTDNVFDSNVVEYNAEEGIRVLGANYTQVSRNFLNENSQRGSRLFRNLSIASLGLGADARGCEAIDNRSYGSMPIL